MTATVHYHHPGQTDDLGVLDHYLYGDPSTGVVLLADATGAVTPELVSAIEPWTGSAP